MKKIIFLSISLLLPPFCFVIRAQQLPTILTTQEYKTGIYKDFSEFLKNEPSVTEKFVIVTLSGERKNEKGDGDFKLVVQDSTYTRKQTKKFWGACDGQSIYINELMYGSKFILKKIGGLGRYCYFKGTPPYNSSYMAVGLMGGAIGGAIAGAANALQADEPYVININNGKAFLLNKETLRLILKKDKGLLDLYEDEARKGSNELMLSYIKQYNVRHVEEILINSWAPIDVAFYRRSKKESDVPFNVLVNENDTLVMETNSIYRFKSWSDTLTACIGNRCQEIVLTKRKINYLQAAWKLNESLPEVKKINIKEGEFYSKEIEFNVVKKNK